MKQNTVIRVFSWVAPGNCDGLIPRDLRSPDLKCSLICKPTLSNCEHTWLFRKSKQGETLKAQELVIQEWPCTQLTGLLEFTEMCIHWDFFVSVGKQS